MTDQKNLQAMKDESIAEIKNMLHEMEHLYENVKGETQEHTKEAKAWQNKNGILHSAA